MGVGEVIGGAAVIGVGVLIGLALVDDRDSDSLATEPALTVDVDATTTSTTTPPTTEPIETTEPATTEAETTQPATTEAPATTEPVETTEAPATTEPVETTEAPTTTEAVEAGQVRVMVLNGGREAGAAQTTSDELAEIGYDVLAPADSEVPAGWTIVYYGLGAREAALSINEVVQTDPALVIEPPPDDPNWLAHGTEVDVLVLLGAE